MSDDVVVVLRPKSLTGIRRNVRWEIVYHPESALWRWSVHVIPPPFECDGEAATQQEAQAQVDAWLRSAVR